MGSLPEANGVLLLVHGVARGTGLLAVFEVPQDASSTNCERKQ